VTTDLVFESVWDALEDSANDAVNMKLRSELMIAIQQAVSIWGGTQAEAAKRLGVSQPHLNDLLRGRIGKFSLDALVSLASRAGLRPSLEITPPGKRGAIIVNKPEGHERLAQIAAKLKNSETVASVTVRELLCWFDAKYRGVHVNETIRDVLFKNDLHLEPDLNAQHIDSSIEFREGAVINEIEEQYYKNYRPLHEGSILNEIEAAMLNKLYSERLCDCLVGWIDRNPGVTEREVRAKAGALYELGFDELEKEDGAEIISLPEPPNRTGRLPAADNLPKQISPNISISGEAFRSLQRRFERIKMAK
jgi:predicted XRE-type DNA-binding protein